MNIVAFIGLSIGHDPTLCKTIINPDITGFDPGHIASLELLAIQVFFRYSFSRSHLRDTEQEIFNIF